MIDTIGGNALFVVLGWILAGAACLGWHLHARMLRRALDRAHAEVDSLTTTRVMPVDVGLAREGFHRIGRIDAVGRRSLWLREESHAIELRAGSEGLDCGVRIQYDSALDGAPPIREPRASGQVQLECKIAMGNPAFLFLRNALSYARFAAEFETPRGDALEPSFALDACPASINRAAERGEL